MTPPTCCRCMEDFPVANRDEPIRMGLLFPLGRFTRWIQDRVRGGGTPYLCGNCYFDLTDE